MKTNIFLRQHLNAIVGQFQVLFSLICEQSAICKGELHGSG